MAEHTGGEWRFTTEDIGDEDFIVVPWEVKSSNGVTVVDSEGGLHSWELPHVSREEREANARLIAAAPKMLVYIARMLIDFYDDASVCEKLTEEFGVTPESAAAAVRAARAGPYPEPQEPGETP